MKMRITIILIGLLYQSYCNAQVGKIFPELEGETLSAEHYALPKDTKGKYTLLGMAYSKKAEPLLKTWFQPAYNKFIAKTGMFDQFYDVNILFIPMFVGVNQTAHKGNMKKMREKENKDLFPHILYFKGKLEPYKESLGMDRKDLPYFYVLNKDGEIVYFTTGRFTAEKMEAIEALLED